MTDHFPDALLGKKVLRLEAQLRRRALKRWLPGKKLGNNWETIRNIYKSRKKILKWYLDRIQPTGQYVRYRDAASLIKNSKLKKKTRERMLYLLRKTSDTEPLSTALAAMKKEFGLNRNQCNMVLKKFRKLGISPITLTNDSRFEELHALRTLLG